LTTIAAPLVYLDANELCLPSDIGAQLLNTHPTLNYTAIANGPSPLNLSDLADLNALGHCDVSSFDECPLYLTSNVNVTSDPAWLHGVLPSPANGETQGARSCAVIVVDHANGTGVVDAFYMYFYAFNLGQAIEGTVLGNHVGDWEHTKVRFENGNPAGVWFSQHDNGQAFAYEAVEKKGGRPVVYSAIGNHANYAVPGTHSRTLVAGVVINDTTSKGPLWDPVLSAYYYSYTPTSSVNGTFVGSEPETPVSWLYFLGRWGDEQYLDSDPRQDNFLNLSLTWRFESGPTGPLDKDLDRKDVCPDNGHACTTLTALPEASGSSVPVTVSRASATSMSTSSSSSSSSSSGKSEGSTTGSGSGASKATGGAVRLGDAKLLDIGLGVAGALVAVL